MENEKIFISYRREDTSGESGRLKDNLEQIFGTENIFYDVETLEAGLNFDQSIAKALNGSKVLLAMIGPHWLKVTDSKGVQRLQNPDDWVRKEIAEALKRKLRVIPVLVNGADMPDSDELPDDLKELSLKHAQELTSSRWVYDVGVLSKVLEKLINKNPGIIQQPNPQQSSPRSFVSPIPEPKNWWAKNYKWAIGGFVFLLLIYLLIPSQPDENGIIDDESANAGLVSDVPADYNPEVDVEWILNEKRNGEEYETTIIFQNGDEGLYFHQYSGEEFEGEGTVQIDNQNLVLMYTRSNYDSTGKLIMETFDSGITWEGKSTYPQFGLTFNSQLYKNSNL